MICFLVPLKFCICIQDYEHLACWIKNSADEILKYFSPFFQKIVFEISYKLSPHFWEKTSIGHVLNFPRDFWHAECLYQQMAV